MKGSEKEEKSLEQKIKEKVDAAIRYYVDCGLPDGELSMAAYHLYRISQLIDVIKAGSKTTNSLTNKIKFLNWILVFIGGAAVLVGIANLVAMSCLK